MNKNVILLVFIMFTILMDFVYIVFFNFQENASYKMVGCKLSNKIVNLVCTVYVA